MDMDIYPETMTIDQTVGVTTFKLLGPDMMWLGVPVAASSA